MTRALLTAIFVGALACTGAPEMPPGAISSEAAQQLILERDEARDAIAARERELSGEIERLRSENADLRSQLGMAAETAEEAARAAAHYQAGLGKAVEELNQVSRDAAVAARTNAYRAGSAAAVSARPARPRASVDYFTSPRMSIVENSIIASGRYFNSGDAEAVGTLYLDLVRNGEVVTTQEQRIRVNQRSWGTWQQEFHFTPGQANVSILARFEED
jgi:hypothetical protein